MEGAQRKEINLFDRSCTTEVYHWMWGAFHSPSIKIIINRGGTSSGKTISALQLFCYKALSEKNKKFLVTTDTVPNIKSGALDDFKKIISYDPDSGFGWDIQDLFAYNMTNRIYTCKLTGSTIQFKPYQDELDAKGHRYDYIYMNEADRVKYSVFKQLLMRLKYKIIVDLNPADENVWVNTELEQSKRKDIAVFKSSYLNNHFLPKSIVEEIERLRNTDPIYWQIYGLGEYGNLSGKIYNNWHYLEDFPELELTYGIDFGFNTTAITKNAMEGSDAYTEELYYGPIQSTEQIIHQLELHQVNKSDYIYCDHDNDQIEILERAGYNVHLAVKDVKAGINFLRSKKWHIKGKNIQKEIKSYRWKQDRHGNIFDEPVKYFDHSMDSGRYGLYSHYKDFHKPIIGKGRYGEVAGL